MYADFSPTRFQPWNPRRFDFYASKVAEVSNTQISTDAESTQIRFSLFNLFQARRRDRESVLHAAREARRRRRIPCRQSEVARRGTDLRLGESHLREWRSHTGAKTRGLAWPVFAQIVGVRAIAHDCESALPRERHEAVPYLRLAVEAAIGGIGEIVRVFELVRLDLDERNVEAGGHSARHLPLRVRVRRATTDGRQHPIPAELLAQYDSEECRIHSARIPKQD